MRGQNWNALFSCGALRVKCLMLRAEGVPAVPSPDWCSAGCGGRGLCTCVCLCVRVCVRACLMIYGSSMIRWLGFYDTLFVYSGTWYPASDDVQVFFFRAFRGRAVTSAKFFLYHVCRHDAIWVVTWRSSDCHACALSTYNNHSRTIVLVSIMFLHLFPVSRQVSVQLLYLKHL